MSWVYFIRARESGHVKIGWTGRAVSARLAELQTGHFDTLEAIGWFEGSPADERFLHWAFERAHVRGEWFRGTPFLRLFADCATRNSRMGLDIIRDRSVEEYEAQQEAN